MAKCSGYCAVCANGPKECDRPDGLDRFCKAAKLDLVLRVDRNVCPPANQFIIDYLKEEYGVTYAPPEERTRNTSPRKLKLGNTWDSYKSRKAAKEDTKLVCLNYRCRRCNEVVSLAVPRSEAKKNIGKGLIFPNNEFHTGCKEKAEALESVLFDMISVSEIPVCKDIWVSKNDNGKKVVSKLDFTDETLNMFEYPGEKKDE